jgi:hypothetical protein
MIFFAAIVMVFLFFSIRHPDFMFWLAVTIFFDPGGYIEFYISRSMIGGIQLWDLQFVLLMIPLLSPKVSIYNYFKSNDNRWIFYFLLSFALIYHIFIYGYLMTGSWGKLINFLQYQRLTIVGFVTIIPAYIFFQRSSILLVKFAFSTSVILAVVYLITLLTGLNILPISQFERGLGTNALRIGMLSYGYADWFISISLVIIMYKIKLERKKWIYFLGITMFVAIILTLTRRSIISIMYSTFLLYFVHQKMINSSVFSIKITKILLAFVLVLLTIFIVKPKYIGYGMDMINNTISVATNAGNNIGKVDQRLENDIPKHIARFKQSPIMGYGYSSTWYSNKTLQGGLSANDVPLTAALGMFGIAGLVFYSFFYFRIFKILFQTYKVLKYSYKNGFAFTDPILFTVSLIILISFINRFTINFMSYYVDIIMEYQRVSMMLTLGIFLASRDMLISKFNQI